MTLWIALGLFACLWLAAPFLVTHWRRRQTRRSLGPLLRHAPHATATLTLHGGRSVLGFAPGSAHLVRADLWVTAEALVVTLGAGELVRLAPASAHHPLRSARATAPNRLILQGTVHSGTWRLEVSVPDASGWAADLAPFVKPGGSSTFGSWSADATPSDGAPVS